MNFIILLVLLTTIFQITRSYNYSYDYFERDNWHTVRKEETHMCPEIEQYEEKVVEPYNHTFTMSYNTFCFRSFSLRCPKFRNETKLLFKTVSVLKTRTTFKCCQGYETVDGKCTAICSGGCVNGECRNPNECHCEVGWKGENCSEECEEGWFGRNCAIPCFCSNGGPCDRFNGTCNCKQRIGTYCESAKGKDENSSKECVNECQCKNGGNFSESDGICHCSPGYFGNYCEKICEAGTFGTNCSSVCACEMTKTEMCSPFDGKCYCLPGWKGDNCDKSCEHGNWGPSCEYSCNCGTNGTCHPVTGVCSCPPGWHGLNCEKICPPGFYAKDCKMKCPDCIHETGICHHETGWCNCPPGVTGQVCDLDCPKGRYGKNCAGFCLCNNNSTCDPITGECSCAPGWIGEECSLPCPDGTFGVNCNFSCNCLNGAICNNTDGICIDEMRVLEEISLKNLLNEAAIDSPFSPFVLQILLGIIIFILVALVISFVWFKIRRKSCLSNMHQTFRVRLQRKQWFKNSEEDREDTSVTNVCQDDCTSITQSSEQFMNPMYEAPKKVLENSRPTSTIPSMNTTNHAESMKDEFDDVPFMIPENNEIMGSPIIQSDVRISIGMDFNECHSKPHPVISYSSTGRTFYFNENEENSVYSNADTGRETRYQNIDEISQIKNDKE